eukprot:INCI15806.1.p1 GENE.INCI15806.1~~INCI15806.1.p1  ORF type:complete len:457 (+),score=120.82 INCI15806.1:153-1523(+)
MMMDQPLTSFKCQGPVADFACHSSIDLTVAGTMKGAVHWVAVAGGAAQEKALVEADALNSGACRNVTLCEAAGLCAASFEEQRIGLFDLQSAKVVQTFDSAHKDGISALASVSNTLLASGDESGVIRLWDLRVTGSAVTGAKPVFESKDNKDYIAKLLPYHHGGKDFMFSCSGDGVLGVFDLRTMKAVALSDDIEEELTCLAVAKRGKKILAGTESGTLAIFSFGQWGDISDRFPGHPEAISSLFALDDNTVLSGGGDGIVRVLSVQPNRFHGALCKHNGFSVNSMGMTFDNKFLVTCSHDRRLRFWDASILKDDDESAASSSSSAKASAGSGGGGGAAKATKASAESANDNASDGALSDSEADSDDSDEALANAEAEAAITSAVEKRAQGEGTASAGGGNVDQDDDVDSDDSDSDSDSDDESAAKAARVRCRRDRVSLSPCASLAPLSHCLCWIS